MRARSLDAAAWFRLSSFHALPPTTLLPPTVAARTITYDRHEGGRWRTYQASLNPATGIYDQDVREVK